MFAQIRGWRQHAERRGQLVRVISSRWPRTGFGLKSGPESGRIPGNDEYYGRGLDVADDTDLQILVFASVHRIFVLDQARQVLRKQAPEAGQHVDRLRQAGLIRRDRAAGSFREVFRITAAGLAVLGSDLPAPRVSGNMREGKRPGWDRRVYQQMREKLTSDRGRKLYAQRKITIEPVFGQIKYNRRIDRFMRRGRSAARSEWRLAAATHNLLKLHSHWDRRHRLTAGWRSLSRVTQCAVAEERNRALSAYSFCVRRPRRRTSRDARRTRRRRAR